MKFQVGDRVKFAGCEGVVDNVLEDCKYSIRVRFDTYLNPISFTEDGKLDFWNKEPLLTLIERPKKKKKVWVNIYPPKDGVNAHFYPSRDEADQQKYIDRIACVEIEVEDTDV